MLGEGGESRFETNVNFFLEEFGINVNTGLCISNCNKCHGPQHHETCLAKGVNTMKGHSSSDVGTDKVGIW